MTTDVTLETVGAGAAPQLFDRHLPEILANIRDLNTDPKKPRKLVLEVSFVPTGDREAAAAVVKCKVVLAPTSPSGGMIHLGKRGDKLVAVTHDFRQEDLFPQATADASVTPLNRSAER